MVALPGCRGCRKPPPSEDEAAAKKEKPKPDFQLDDVVMQPGTGGPTSTPLAARPKPIKPGHWTSLALEGLKANNFDFGGELGVGITPRDRDAQQIPATPYVFGAGRPVVLGKGQPRHVEATVYVPPAAADADLRLRLRSRRQSGFEPGALRLKLMPSYQYHLVVAARLPERYRFLDSLDSVVQPTSFVENDQPFFLVSRHAGDKPLRLPGHLLWWTSVAAMIWDDADPSMLDDAQQTALIDWVHWGGQLIVSAPDSLDGLAGSFLEPYLPAASAGAREFKNEGVVPLQRWSPPGAGNRLVLTQPLSGVQLKLASGGNAQFVPGAGDLVAERRVGRGRVLLSAFRLGGRDITAWAGFDSFVNSCLLGRPSRKFSYSAEQGVTVNWATEEGVRSQESGVRRNTGATGSASADEDTSGADLLVIAPPSEYQPWLDAARSTHLRLFARDAGASFADYAPDVHGRSAFEEAARVGGVWGAPAAPSEPVRPAVGVGGWNDFSPVSAAARESLLSAARIEIPRRDFVIWTLAGYLVLLVPVNWVVFKLLGRIEWAWIAAPVIAVAYTVLVIRSAQLDIGFVRSRTEVGVLEVMGDHPRAHLTRYTAHYTSFTTAYEMRSADPGSVMLPFPNVPRPEQFRMPLGMSLRTIERHTSDQVVTRGFSVTSNSTALTHGEEMLDLGGTLRLVEDGERRLCVRNDTTLALRGVCVLWRSSANECQAAWLGDLSSGDRQELTGALNWRPGDESPLAAHRGKSALTAAQPLPGDLNIEPLVKLAQRGSSLRVGEYRLVAWTDTLLPGLEIRPAAPQARAANLVVACLRQGWGPPPLRDVRAKAELPAEARQREN